MNPNNLNTPRQQHCKQLLGGGGGVITGGAVTGPVIVIAFAFIVISPPLIVIFPPWIVVGAASMEIGPAVIFISPCKLMEVSIRGSTGSLIISLLVSQKFPQGFGTKTVQVVVVFVPSTLKVKVQALKASLPAHIHGPLEVGLPCDLMAIHGCSVPGSISMSVADDAA